MLEGFAYGFGFWLGAAAALTVTMVAGFLVMLAWSAYTRDWEHDDPKFKQRRL